MSRTQTLFLSVLAIFGTISVIAVLLIVRDFDRSITRHHQITELHESLNQVCSAYTRWKTVAHDQADGMERVCNRDDTE